MTDINRRHRTSRIVGVVVAVAALGFTAACGSSSSGGSGDRTYQVGYAATISGPAAAPGQALVDGVQLAVEEIKSSKFLGAGAKVKLDVQDDHGDPAQGISLYKQFSSDGSSVVLCCGLSSVGGAMAPIIKAGKVPAVVNAAVLPGLPSPPKIFRTVLLSSAEGGLYDQTVDAVVAKRNIKSAAIIVTADNDGMVAAAEVWKRALDRNGVKIVKTINTGAADTNFNGPATTIAALHPDAVVMDTIGTATALAARALRSYGFSGTLLSDPGAAAPDLFKASNGGLAGTVMGMWFAAGSTNNPEAQKFVDAFQKKYGKAPGLYEAFGYNSMWFVAEGLKKAGTTDPAAVAKALSEVRSQASVFGDLTYSGGQAALNGKATMLAYNRSGGLEPFGP